MSEQRGFVRTFVRDGVGSLMATSSLLILAGCVAMVLALTGEFLPHDLAYVGMSADQLCGIADCHIVHFLLHDRMAFGGAVFGIGVLYGYLTLFPLRRGEAWAWWLLLISGVLGFSSFLGYLSFGYLDTWHAAITVLLLPLFVIGLAMAWRTLDRPRSFTDVVRPTCVPNLHTRAGIGRVVLLLGAAGTFVAGFEIFRIGLMETFVPADLTFIGVSAEHLEHVNDRLVPLIAHDRAGFGAAVVIQGLLSFGCLWSSSTAAEVSKTEVPKTEVPKTEVPKVLWWAILLAGAVSLGAAIGTHFIVGYIDLWHLAPPAAAAVSLVIGLTLSYPVSRQSTGSSVPRVSTRD
ncbi:MAG: hypothetical protein WBF79_03420 [Rhodococcus sp. (in: high G+C Gram-positive bacteria)]